VFLQIVFVAGPMVAHRTGKFTLLMSCTYVFSEYISIRRGKITEAAFMWLCIQMDAIGVLPKAGLAPESFWTIGTLVFSL